MLRKIYLIPEQIHLCPLTTSPALSVNVKRKFKPGCKRKAGQRSVPVNRALSAGSEVRMVAGFGILRNYKTMFDWWIMNKSVDVISM